MARLRWRIKLLAVEIRLAGLYLATKITEPDRSLGPVSFFLVMLGGAMCMALLTRLPFMIANTVLIALGVVMMAFTMRCAPESDQPLIESTQNYPKLQAELRDIAALFKVPVPRHIGFCLSLLPWQPFGIHAGSLQRKGFPVIPVGCLQIWSLTTFRCFLARMLVRRRRPRWLFSPLLSCLPEIQFDPAAKYSRFRTARNRFLARQIMREMMKWSLLADFEADLRMAVRFGPAPVADYVSETAAAAVATRTVLKTFAPAIRKGLLPPIATACRQGYERLKSSMEDRNSQSASARQEGSAERRVPDPIQIRLRLLQSIRGGFCVVDPRPASVLFSSLPELEERVVRWEIRPPVPLRRVSMPNQA